MVMFHIIFVCTGAFILGSTNANFIFPSQQRFQQLEVQEKEETFHFKRSKRSANDSEEDHDYIDYFDQVVSQLVPTIFFILYFF